MYVSNPVIMIFSVCVCVCVLGCINPFLSDLNYWKSIAVESANQRPLPPQDPFIFSSLSHSHLQITHFPPPSLQGSEVSRAGRVLVGSCAREVKEKFIFRSEQAESTGRKTGKN